MTYTFTGKPATVKHVRTATGKTSMTRLYTYTYDNGDRLKSVTHKLDSHAAVTIVNNTYDNLGRLQKNSRNGHGKLATSYGYNVRNWMTKNSSPLFSESITYGYGGNIATVQWTTNGNEKRKYAYTYDGLSRLTYAAYSTENVGGSPMHGAFYNYDKHGNIQYLYRYGLMADGNYGQPDYLKMTYDGNRLVHVKDESFTAPAEQSNDFRQGSTASTHYFYDKNGRLVKDLNKNITNISYNSLHLPSSITVNGTTHTYVYAADGRKLRVVEGGVPRDYVGNLIYENGSLKRILFDGGYIEGGLYHFYLTDYLGNVSTVADATGNLVQQNRYYPFGLPTAETSDSEQDKQPYKYNGKELDRTNGLNWYDYGARMYDPALCRFMTMDPLAEKYYGISPYAYCRNNPVLRRDPDGMWDVIIHAYNNRAIYGYAILNVTDRFGKIVYTTTVRVEGSGKNKRDRTQTNADTPTGKYRIRGWSDRLSKLNSQSYGPNNVLELDYIEGEAVGLRNGIHIHGGRQADSGGKNNGARLIPTYGCIRMYDEDIAEMNRITDELETNDSEEKGNFVTVVNDLRKNKDGSYDYPTQEREEKSNSNGWFDFWMTLTRFRLQNPNIKVNIK